MTDGEREERYTIKNESEFPSIELSLEEVRRNYDTEMARKSNIEVRIGAIVGIDALLISVVGVVGDVHPATKLLILLPALAASGFGLSAFNSREYRKPGPETDELFGYARMDHPNAAKDFIQNYRQAISHNMTQNKRRMDTLDTCFKLTTASFILILLSPVLDVVFTELSTFLGL